jgi:hypothetical protein
MLVVIVVGSGSISLVIMKMEMVGGWVMVLLGFCYGILDGIDLGTNKL